MYVACSVVGSGHRPDWHILPNRAFSWLSAAAVPCLGQLCVSAQLHTVEAEHSSSKSTCTAIQKTSSHQVVLHATPAANAFAVLSPFSCKIHEASAACRMMSYLRLAFDSDCIAGTQKTCRWKHLLGQRAQLHSWHRMQRRP